LNDAEKVFLLLIYVLIFIALVGGKRCDAVGIFERGEVAHRAKYNSL
jgi:hypothetical protein